MNLIVDIFPLLLCGLGIMHKKICIMYVDRIDPWCVGVTCHPYVRCISFLQIPCMLWCWPLTRIKMMMIVSSWVSLRFCSSPSSWQWWWWLLTLFLMWTWGWTWMLCEVSAFVQQSDPDFNPQKSFFLPSWCNIYGCSPSYLAMAKKESHAQSLFESSFCVSFLL